MKSESPIRLDVISPLTVNSDTSLVASAKTPSTGSLKDYLKYDLFRNIEEDLRDRKIKKSKNVGQVSETNPISKYSELNEKILEIVKRDLELINSCEAKNQNKIRT